MRENQPDAAAHTPLGYLFLGKMKILGKKRARLMGWLSF
jgi:hypothetical protein